MKPECEACRETGGQGLSSIFGREIAEKLAYLMFNPEAPLGDEGGKLDLEQLTGSEKLDGWNDALDEILAEMIREGAGGIDYRRWMEERLRRERARDKAWQNILERIKKGELNPEDIPLKQMLRNFSKKIAEGLAEDGLLDIKLQRRFGYPEPYLGYAQFTVEGERVIARKVLEEALLNLEKLGIGTHEVKEAGFGVYPSNILREFDEYKHSYDLIDIQETLLSTAIRDPEKMRISDEDLKARIPLHKARTSNVILLDVSNSMAGVKFKGGVMAALALRQLFEEEYKDELLHVVAYNDEPFIVPPGHLLRLRPSGFTDIGRAIDLSLELLSREEGNKNIFLITDSEPTASYKREYSPVENSYRAAFLAGREKVRLNIIMLDKRAVLRSICERMAELDGNASVVYIDNPLCLKEFIIKTFVDHKRMLREG